MNNKRKIAYLDEQTHYELRKLAATRGVTMQVVIKQVLEDYLKGNKK